METKYIIRKTRPGETTKKWKYSAKEARDIIKDLRKRTPDAKITIRRAKRKRGRTIRTGGKR